MRVTNANVPDGIALHWHGIDVPNAEDGVAGVTQDAIGPGRNHTYRFVVDRVGSYWYHSHQVSHVQVTRGLFGPLIVLPPAGIDQDRDVAAVAHTYRGVRTLNAVRGDVPVARPTARPYAYAPSTPTTRRCGCGRTPTTGSSRWTAPRSTSPRWSRART